jgi:hypothetical protein
MYQEKEKGDKFSTTHIYLHGVNLKEIDGVDALRCN